MMTSKKTTMAAKKKKKESPTSIKTINLINNDSHDSDDDDDNDNDGNNDDRSINDQQQFIANIDRFLEQRHCYRLKLEHLKKKKIKFIKNGHKIIHRYHDEIRKVYQELKLLSEKIIDAYQNYEYVLFYLFHPCVFVHCFFLFFLFIVFIYDGDEMIYFLLYL